MLVKIIGTLGILLIGASLIGQHYQDTHKVATLPVMGTNTLTLDDSLDNPVDEDHYCDENYYSGGSYVVRKCPMVEDCNKDVLYNAYVTFCKKAI